MDWFSSPGVFLHHKSFLIVYAGEQKISEKKPGAQCPSDMILRPEGPIQHAIILALLYRLAH